VIRAPIGIVKLLAASPRRHQDSLINSAKIRDKGYNALSEF